MDPYPYPDHVPGHAPLPPPPNPYPPPQPPNSSAIVLIVFSGLALLSGYCCYISIPSLVFGILGVTQHASDPEGAARMTRIGWVVFAALVLLTLLVIGGFFVYAVMES